MTFVNWKLPKSRGDCVYTGGYGKFCPRYHQISNRTWKQSKDMVIVGYVEHNDSIVVFQLESSK